MTEVHRETGGAVLFSSAHSVLYGDKNTDRSPWNWFFLGLFFHVITVLVLLEKNGDDRRQARGEPAASGFQVCAAILGGLVLVAAMGIAVYFLLAK